MEANVSEKIVTSLTDTHLYRFIRLPNGLRALLVHDPEVYLKVDEANDLNIYLNENEEEEKVNNLDIYSNDEEEEKANNLDIYSNDEEEELHDLEIYLNEDEDEEEKGSKEIGVDGLALKGVAAAMCVGVGSFSDPNEAQGLAHLLEHMLSMGSALFPDENEYDSYLSEHGGFSNARTNTERTCYYFYVKGEFLKGALTRFAQFFISPLVKAEAMEREILVVDSEFNKGLQNDSLRLKQLRCHTSSSRHPFNRFFWGNKKSWSDAMKNGVHLREYIMNLYHDYYHGESMTLVVIGGESLDILEGWVRDLFGSVRKGSLVKPETCLDGPIWKPGKIYKLEAVEDVHLLHLSWTLPSLQEHYLTKAEEYFSYLLGHEGKGSLCFLLKAKGWVSSLAAGVPNDGMYCSSIAYIYQMDIHLTDSGLEKIFDIIGFVYQYLKRLHLLSPQKWIFKELQDIGKLTFILEKEQSQDNYAVKLAEQLHVYPPKHVIYGEYAYENWDEEMIKYILGFFNPGNMRVDLQTKSFDKSLGLCLKRKRKKSLRSTCQGTNLSRQFFWGVRKRKKSIISDIQLEPWFGSRYVEKDIPHALMKLWKDPPRIDSSLQLPSKNKFIPHDFSVCATKETCESAAISSSRCIIDEPMMEFCYKPIKTLKLPHVDLYFDITLKSGHSSLRNSLLSELFTLLLKDELNEIIYQANEAKLELSISLHDDKLKLGISGLIDKLPVLLSEVLAIVKSFVPKDDRFRVIKEDKERTLKNTIMDPQFHCGHAIEQVLYKSFWTVEEKWSMLNNLSLADLEVFIPDLFSQLYIEGHCHGNLLEKEALNISDILKSNFSVPPLPIEMRHEKRVVCLPPSADLVRDVRVKNKLETNSIVRLYFQIEPNTFELYALTVLFGDLVSEQFFDVLRTKEQLGYDVHCMTWETFGILGYYFQVQSSKFNPVYLLERIDNFINGLEEMLNGFNNDSFENYRSASMNKLLQADLPSFTDRIGQGQNICNRCSTEIPEFGRAESFEKSDIINWYNTYLKKPSMKCRRLAIRVWGRNTDMKILNEQPSYRQELKDIEAFKNSSGFYECFEF